MRDWPLLIDVSACCDAHTDAALELLAKAVGEDPPGGDIWDAHPNPYIRSIVEQFTKRGLERIEGVREELQQWLSGGEYDPRLQRPLRPAGAMQRWSRAEVAIVRVYLKALPPEIWTLDDWLMLVDYLAQRYLPYDDLRTESDWMASRSNIMGRVQSVLGDTDEDTADIILAKLPTAEDFRRMFGMSEEQWAALEFGRARSAQYVTRISDEVRDKLRTLITNYQEAVFLGNKAEAAESLQSRLLDEFGTLNRDWRRIAVTEAGENLNQGFIASQAPGTKLRRTERYRGACAFCRQIDGVVVTVVDPSKEKKDGDKEVWLGKNNVGRSASPRKRVGGQLVDRAPDEMWWIPAGLAHPHCRGGWVKEVAGAREDPEFEAWLNGLKKDRK